MEPIFNGLRLMDGSLPLVDVEAVPAVLQEGGEQGDLTVSEQGGGEDVVTRKRSQTLWRIPPRLVPTPVKRTEGAFINDCN